MNVIPLWEHAGEVVGTAYGTCCWQGFLTFGPTDSRWIAQKCLVLEVATISPHFRTLIPVLKLAPGTRHPCGAGRCDPGSTRQRTLGLAVGGQTDHVNRHWIANSSRDFHTVRAVEWESKGWIHRDNEVWDLHANSATHRSFWSLYLTHLHPGRSGCSS